MDVTGTITRMDTNEQINIKALVDCGCTGSCIDKNFIAEHKIATVPVLRPIPVWNADGTPNVGGDITHYVQLKLRIADHEELIDLAVTDLHKTNMFLGHDWLQEHNPLIDWREKNIEFSRCQD